MPASNGTGAVKGKSTAINSDSRVWRILIVDDHPLVQTGLTSLIEREPDLEICGRSASIGEALELVRSTSPDLAIVDLSLADGNGLTLVKRLRASHSHIRTLVCSMHDEALFAYRAIKAGAMGYIGKEEATTKVVDAIRRVLSGKVWLSANMSDRVFEGLVSGGSVPAGSSVDNLSDRELEVFELIGRGLGASQLAERLHLSVKTIESHRENIKKKLGLRSAAELTRRAMQWSLDQDEG